MGLQVKHKFTSPKLDGPDATMVRPSNWNADHDIFGTGLLPAGTVIDYTGHTVPTGFLECYGQSVAAASYPTLFSSLVKQSTVTLTLGSPGTVNWTDHGLIVGSKVRFRTTGALPTGLVANTDYFIVSTGFTTSAFRVAATAGGTAIDFTGSQSGVHTGVSAQYGVSNDLSTFTVPDLRGRVTAGLDVMGGTSANRLTSAGGLDGDVLGAVGGVETHTLTLAQLAAHQHNNNPPNPTVTITGIAVTVDSGGAHTHTVTGTISTVADHTHTVNGTAASAGAHTHTVTGTVDSGGSHTHTNSLTIEGSSIGMGGGHTHAHALDIGGTLGSEAAHTHNSGTLAGVTDTEAAHSHNVGANVATNTVATGSADRVVSLSAGGVGEQVAATNTGGAHAHTVDVNSGNTGAGTSHTHSITGLTVTGTITAVGDHTHSLTGGTIGGSIGTAAAHTHTFSAGAAASSGAHTHTVSGTAELGGGHTHTFSAGAAASGGAHVHTASATGTATSALADFLSDNAGGGAAHPNVQPTFIVRKLLYVG